MNRRLLRVGARKRLAVVPSVSLATCAVAATTASITGDWTVPTASQHSAGQSEDSSDWIGIGGGCIDAGCTATDSTLIHGRAG
jgi:hypothetical protein